MHVLYSKFTLNGNKAFVFLNKQKAHCYIIATCIKTITIGSDADALEQSALF
jgi:hypothetical protein